MEVATT